MSTAIHDLLALEEQAAEEGRQYGREKLRQRLQAIAEEQGALCPSSGERLENARFGNLPLITTLGQFSIRARYGYHRNAQKWMFAVQDLWGLKSRQEISPHLQQALGYTATECGSCQKAAVMAKNWGVKIGTTTIHKQVQILGAEPCARKSFEPNVRSIRRLVRPSPGRPRPRRPTRSKSSVW